MMSHALGGLAGSRRTLQQRAADGCHVRHLESMTSYQKIRLHQSMRILLEEILPNVMQIRSETTEPAFLEDRHGISS